MSNIFKIFCLILCVSILTISCATTQQSSTNEQKPEVSQPVNEKPAPVAEKKVEEAPSSNVELVSEPDKNEETAPQPKENPVPKEEVKKEADKTEPETQNPSSAEATPEAKPNAKSDETQKAKPEASKKKDGLKNEREIEANAKIAQIYNKYSKQPTNMQEYMKKVTGIKTELEDFVKNYKDTDACTDAYIKLGLVSRSLQDLDSSEKYFKLALDSAKDDMMRCQAGAYLAFVYFNKNKKEDSNKLLTELEQKYSDKDSVVMLASVRMQIAKTSNDVEGYVANVKKLMEVFKDNKTQYEKLYSNLLNTLYDQDKPEEVKKYLEALKKDIPDSKLIEEFQTKLKLVVGAPPLDFKVNSLKNVELSPDTYKGKVYLIDFWATWCGPCKREFPHIKELYNKYHEKGFNIIGISLDKDKDALDAFIKEKNVTWEQYFDGKGWDNDIAKIFGIHSIPTAILVGADGNIINKDIRSQGLKEKLEEIYGKVE